MTSRFKQSGKRQMAAADRSAAASSANVMSAILKQARKSGQLNLSNRSLDEGKFQYSQWIVYFRQNFHHK